MNDFVADFLAIDIGKRYLFGINEYANSISEIIDVGGFIDDFSDEQYHLGKPIIKTVDVPDDALVIATLAGKPLTAHNILKDAGIRHIDYFSLTRHIDKPFSDVRFWGDFPKEYQLNRSKYSWLQALFKDELSLLICNKIINFRLSGNISYLNGFFDRQPEQYFESFLCFKEDAEVFIDVGGFDGFTSLKFMQTCPTFKAVHIFEPDANNVKLLSDKFDEYNNVYVYQKGLADFNGTVNFKSDGSTSGISMSGECQVEVVRLDDVVDGAVTYIKMDVEGAEHAVLEGAKEIIKKQHPKLAVCVYHQMNDLWTIPEKILSIRDDYDIYLRQYTEGVVETVMFFIPK